jgi:hypothetical protein
MAAVSTRAAFPSIHISTALPTTMTLSQAGPLGKAATPLHLLLHTSSPVLKIFPPYLSRIFAVQGMFT